MYFPTARPSILTLALPSYVGTSHLDTINLPVYSLLSKLSSTTTTVPLILTVTFPGAFDLMTMCSTSPYTMSSASTVIIGSAFSTVKLASTEAVLKSPVPSSYFTTTV